MHRFATRGRRAALGAVLMWAMAATTAGLAVFPVLASALIDEFDISRAQFGFFLTMLTVLGAFASPIAGTLVDVLGGRTSLVILFVAAGTAFIVFAVSPAFWVLFIGAAITGVGGSSANPATNKLIAALLPPGRRAMVTGVKQTGPQVSAFLGGVLAPWGAAAIGWRGTMGVVGVVAFLAVPFLLRVVPADERETYSGDGTAGRRLPAAIWWLGGYGFLLGFGGSATFLVPLFAEEALGYGIQAAGTAAALIGLVAIAGRLGWASISDRTGRYDAALGLIALLSVAAGAAFVAAQDATALLWVAVVVIGLSASSWTAVGSLTVIATAGPGLAGRGSGVVWFGFLTGLAGGPPLYGAIVDVTGSYAGVWWLATGVFAAAVLVAAAGRRTFRTEPA